MHATAIREPRTTIAPRVYPDLAIYRSDWVMPWALEPQTDDHRDRGLQREDPSLAVTGGMMGPRRDRPPGGATIANIPPLPDTRRRVRHERGPGTGGFRGLIALNSGGSAYSAALSPSAASAFR